MNLPDIRLFLVSIFGITFTFASEQKPIFIPDPVPAAEAKTEVKAETNGISPPSHKEVKANDHLNLFLKLPYKVLPLKPTERQLALKHKEITSRIVNKETVVSYIANQVPFITEMKCIAYTIDREPVVEVIYTWDNPGLINQSHSYTYRLTRKTNGWLSVRIR